MAQRQDNVKKDSLPAGRGHSGGRLSASGVAAVGGLLWLVGSLALALWLGRDESPFPEGGMRPAAATRGAQAVEEPAAAATSFAALEELDALVEGALTRVLPHARWEKSFTPIGTAARAGEAAPTAPASDGDAAKDGNGVPRGYTVTGPCAPLRLGFALLEELRHFTRRQAGLREAGAPPHVAWTPEGALEVRVGGLATHRVRFPGREAALAVLAQPLPRPALVLVLDDMGQNLEAAETLAALPFPVTFAILPHTPKAAETAKLAEFRRLDCLLHLPLEALPRANGHRPNPGRGALGVGMERADMAATLEENLDALPSAMGLNNHMGSAFTGNAAACGQLSALLSGRGLFVLDSLTSAGSRLAEEAGAAGIVHAGRDVFLDTRRDTASILAALNTAAARARANGHAVAIGHPYQETLAVLRNWRDDAGVAIVPMRRLAWNLALEWAKRAP